MAPSLISSLILKSHVIYLMPIKIGVCPNIRKDPLITEVEVGYLPSTDVFEEWPVHLESLMRDVVGSEAAFYDFPGGDQLLTGYFHH